MKIKLEKKYIQMGLTIFLSALAILFVVFFIWKNASIKAFFQIFKKALAPVFYGLIIAYILAPILNFIEHKILVPLFHKIKIFEPQKDKNRDKHIRFIGVILTLVCVFLFLYIFFSSVIPELIKSVQIISIQYSNYTKNLVVWINRFLEKYPDLQVMINEVVFSYTSTTDNWINDFVLPNVQKLLPNVGDILVGLSSNVIKFFGFLWNIVIGLIISIYVLSSKEKFGRNCTRLCYAFLETKNANKFIESVRFTHRTFIGFLSGKVLDSLIIGVITFIVLSIMHMPYAVLISMVVGVTNIIPFFGPWFGAIPSAFILLMVNPRLALYFLIYIVIIQQVDGNLIGPTILSQTTGITTFWIICSITVFSGFFGVVGMIIAVPVTAVIFALFTNITDNLLRKKNLPTSPDEYSNVGSISETGEITRYVYEKPIKEKTDTKFSLFLKKIFSRFKKKTKPNDNQE